MNRRSPKRGSAVVELAILLPLYAFVILSALYFGYGWLVQQEGVESNAFAAIKPGSQSADIPDHFYKAYEGTATQTEEDWSGNIFWADNPTSGNDPMDFHDILTELSYTFWGGFKVSGGGLVWETEGGLNGTGQHIEDHDMMSDESLDGMQWMMNDWVTRDTARTTYVYNPTLLGGMNAEVGPTAGKVTADNRFQALQIRTETHAMVRGERTRPLYSAWEGVGENVYELIDRFSDAERMPGKPDFGGGSEFWDQEYRPDLDG